MKKKTMLLTTMLLLFAGMAHAQGTAYTYVKQNGSYVSADGTAAFDVSSTPAVMKFDDDENAIMTIGVDTVAKIRANERNIDVPDDATAGALAKGVLAADFDNQSGNSTTGTLPVTVDASDAEATLGYLTLYSPFQLKINDVSGVNVYASTYDAANNALKCNSSTKIANTDILPVCTSLVLMNPGTVNFAMTAESSTYTKSEDIKGYAVTMPLPDLSGDQKIYTLGHARTVRSKFGFFKYVNKTYLNAGKAYLIAEDLDVARPEEETSGESKYITFDFSEDATSINNVASSTKADSNGKFIDNGRVVIVKSGKKFNLIGQEVK